MWVDSRAAFRVPALGSGCPMGRFQAACGIVSPLHAQGAHASTRTTTARLLPIHCFIHPPANLEIRHCDERGVSPTRCDGWHCVRKIVFLRLESYMPEHHKSILKRFSEALERSAPKIGWAIIETFQSHAQVSCFGLFLDDAGPCADGSRPPPQPAYS